MTDTELTQLAALVADRVAERVADDGVPRILRGAGQ